MREGVRRVVRIGGLVLGVALAAYFVLFPRVSYERGLYWLKPSARVGALHRLVAIAPDGGWLELKHALGSRNERLRFSAASNLAERGDADGIRGIVQVHYMCPYRHLKFDPHVTLREFLQADPGLDDHDSAEEWWSANRDRLVYRGKGHWSLGP